MYGCKYVFYACNIYTVYIQYIYVHTNNVLYVSIFYFSFFLKI